MPVPQGFADLCRSLAGHSGERMTCYLVSMEVNELWSFAHHNPSSLTEAWKQVGLPEREIR